MRDFDEERAKRFSRERSFKIGGEVFTFRIGMHPEVFDEIVQPYNALTVLSSLEDSLAGVDAAIEGFLETDDDRERWRRVREKRADVIQTQDPEELAVTARDMREVLEWIIAEQTGHPTTASSSSGNGQGRSTQNSTENSSSPVAASAASTS